MTQDEKWQAKYEEVMEFNKKNKRNPSKHRIEEHDMLNWLKANRKLENAGKLKAERVEKFGKLLEMTEQYKRINQRRRMMYDGLRYNYTNEITWYVRFQLPHQESANCHIKNRPTATFIVKKVAEFEI